MVPKIARGGSSFKGAFAYYLHDKGAQTSSRVDWVQTENMRTSDPQKAWKIMAFTAKEHERLKEASGQSRAGRKLEKPVFAFSLAWHPEQSPPREHMLETARKAIAMLGLTEHEAVIVSHRDEPQKHVHVIVNRVHPFTGLAGDVRNSKRKFSDFAREYEREHGKIYCQRREENHEKREKGKTTRYCDPHIVEAWQTTKTGTDFAAALKAKGYVLARGNHRVVVVDPYGKCHNPTRHLEGVKARDMKQRLADLVIFRLPTADKAIEELHRIGKSNESPQEERMRRADELLAFRLDELERKHARERMEHNAQHERRLEFSQEHLANSYGLKERRGQITTLKEKLQQAPWWKKLLRLTKKDRKALAEQVRSYRSAHQRYKERVAKITKEGRENLHTLLTKHAKERGAILLHDRKQRELHFGNTQEKARSHDWFAPGLAETFTVAQKTKAAERVETGALVQAQELSAPGLAETFAAASQQKSAQNAEKTSGGRKSGGTVPYNEQKAEDHGRTTDIQRRREDGGREL